MNSWTRAAWILYLVAASTAAAFAADRDEPLDRRLDKAAGYARSDRAAEAAKAIAVCEAAIADKDATEEQRVRAFSILVQSYQSQKKPLPAAKAAVRLRETMPNSKLAEQASLLLEADLAKAQGKPDAALEKARELIGRQPENPEGHQRLAELLFESGKNADAYQAAAKAAELKPLKEETFQRALRSMLEAATRLNEHEKCVAVIVRLIEFNTVTHRDEWSNRDLRRRQVSSLLALKRYDEARTTAAAAEKAEREDSQRQPWAVLIGDCYLDEKQYDQALAAYEKVFTDYRTVDAWFATQRKIVDALAKKGAAADALKAAHVLFDAAHEPYVVADAARLVGELFKAVDSNVARANAFIAYQRLGPGGEDGKGHLKNPLEEIGYPPCPQREKAFDEFRKAAGDNAAASRIRALTFIYSGQPKQALRLFLDAFGRCGTDELQLRADELILIGARAARGHSVGMEEFYNYLNYGPAGADGKRGTPDDVADPFAPLLK